MPTISMLVTEYGTGNPIAGAEMKVYRYSDNLQQGSSVITGADGIANATVPYAGRYYVTATDDALTIRHSANAYGQVGDIFLSDLPNFFRTFNDGVNKALVFSALLPTPTGSARQVSVAAGSAFVDGHFFSTSTPTLLTHDVNVSGNPRNDIITLQLTTAGVRVGALDLVIVKGTPAASPADPTLVIADRVVLPIARVRINNAQGVIPGGQITDLRVQSGAAPGQYTITDPTQFLGIDGYNGTGSVIPGGQIIENTVVGGHIKKQSVAPGRLTFPSVGGARAGVEAAPGATDYWIGTDSAMCSAPTEQVLNANRVYYMPLILADYTKISDLAIYKTSGTTTGTVYLGVVDTTGSAPGTDSVDLLAGSITQTGAISVLAAAASYYSAPLSAPVTPPPGFHWLVYLSSAAIPVDGFSAAVVPKVSFGRNLPIGATSHFKGYYRDVAGGTTVLPTSGTLAITPSGPNVQAKSRAALPSTYFNL